MQLERDTVRAFRGPSSPVRCGTSPPRLRLHDGPGAHWPAGTRAPWSSGNPPDALGLGHRLHLRTRRDRHGFLELSSARTSQGHALLRRVGRRYRGNHRASVDLCRLSSSRCAGSLGQPSGVGVDSGGHLGRTPVRHYFRMALPGAYGDRGAGSLSHGDRRVRCRLGATAPAIPPLRLCHYGRSGGQSRAGSPTRPGE